MNSFSTHIFNSFCLFGMFICCNQNNFYCLCAMGWMLILLIVMKACCCDILSSILFHLYLCESRTHSTFQSHQIFSFYYSRTMVCHVLETFVYVSEVNSVFSLFFNGSTMQQQQNRRVLVFSQGCA